MIHEGLKNLAAGANPIVVKKGMSKAVEAAVAEVKKQSKSVDGSKAVSYTHLLPFPSAMIPDLPRPRNREAFSFPADFLTNG